MFTSSFVAYSSRLKRLMISNRLFDALFCRFVHGSVAFRRLLLIYFLDSCTADNFLLGCGRILHVSFAQERGCFGWSAQLAMQCLALCFVLLCSY